MPKGEDYKVNRKTSLDVDGGAAGKENSLDGPANRVKDGESGGSQEGPARINGMEVENDSQAGHAASAPQTEKVAKGPGEAEYVADMERLSAENTALLRQSLGYRDLTPGAGTHPDTNVKHNQQDDVKGNYDN